MSTDKYMTATMLPSPQADWALFLDFDGTLADIAASPCRVQIDARLPATLVALRDVLDGAVALVSGRPLAQLDAFLAPLVLPASGLHGLEHRDANGAVIRAAVPTAALTAARESLAAFAAGEQGVVLEDKGLSLALHYRGAPGRQSDCRRAAEEALVASSGALHLLDGKMIFELKPYGADKGSAIEAFLAEAPFAGRVPVFAGDDRTDEDGFAVVNRRGGMTVRVGDDAATRARWRVGSVDELLVWLAAAPAAIAAGSEVSRKGARGS